MPQPIYVADAFTDVPFGGNPAAVVPLDRPADETWMKRIAAEMNLSETAFLVPVDDGYGLRWLTPTIEVKLCGHATLASAHILWETGRTNADAPIKFHTKSGLLTATPTPAGIELDFPARPAMERPAPAGLVEGLGCKPLWIGADAEDYLCELPDEATVRELRPDHAALRQVAARGIIVTAKATTLGLDFVSRFFAPGSGIDEDPVTGSAHCALAPFWSPRLGKTDFVAYQASARGGTLRVRLVGERVKLVGRAITVWCGELLV